MDTASKDTYYFKPLSVYYFWQPQGFQQKCDHHIDLPQNQIHYLNEYNIIEYLLDLYFKRLPKSSENMEGFSFFFFFCQATCL